MTDSTASDPEQTFTDLDEHVTLRLRAGTILVEVSASGFRQPPNVIANLVTELAGRLPRPGAESDDALASGIEGLGKLQQAAASGGYEGFAAMMRGRLGIEAPVGSLGRDPDFDRAIAENLNGVLKSMRDAASNRSRPPREVLTAEVYTDEGDIGVTCSSERVVADVWIGPDARRRGVDGLGEALTDTVARARAKLEELSGKTMRERLPEGFAQVADEAPEHARKAEQQGMAVIGEVNEMTEALKRKAGRA